MIDENFLDVVFELEGPITDLVGKEMPSSLRHFGIRNIRNVKTNEIVDVKKEVFSNTMLFFSNYLIIPDWLQYYSKVKKSPLLVIDRLSILPVHLTFSFQQSVVPKQLEKRIHKFNLLIRSLGLALTNVEEAPIDVKLPQMENIFDYVEEFVDRLKEHCLQELKKCILPVMGSLNVIGNPTRFFRHVQSGVVEFIDRPKEGFREGVGAGAVGMVQGTESLLKNTVRGALENVSKTSELMANTAAAITLVS
jgi:hypothetical protein